MNTRIYRGFGDQVLHPANRYVPLEKNLSAGAQAVGAVVKHLTTENVRTDDQWQDVW